MNNPLRCIALSLALCTASALELRTDRPHDWANPYASHHSHHFAAGAILAAPVYLGCHGVGFQRGTSALLATGASALAGIAYEIQRAPGGAYCDPVDMGWTAAGGAMSALLCYSADRWVVSPALSRESQSLVLAWRF